MEHTVSDDFEHFLSYSGFHAEPPHIIEKLKRAYEAAWEPAPKVNVTGTMPNMITDHQINDLNKSIRIAADERKPEFGNGSHHYRMIYESENTGTLICEIHFQQGPPSEVGCNGITNEALLAIVIDRLRGFQAGQFACRENALALTKLEEALHWLQSRSLDRIKRGVEGTYQK